MLYYKFCVLFYYYYFAERIVSLNMLFKFPVFHNSFFRSAHSFKAPVLVKTDFLKNYRIEMSL